MSGLGRRQAEFAAAILDPALPVPAGLIGPDGEPSAKRFAVYRNNVVAGLCEALKAAFPAVRRIVGDAFFAAMARLYVPCEPPNSPIMLDYGAGFAGFVDRFEPAAALPYLGDVARLERAWAEAYHTAEAEPLDPMELAAIAPGRLPHIGLLLHPSLRMVRSPFPAVTIWQMNVDGGVPVPVDFDGGGEDALIVRPAAEVEVHVLPPGAAAFIAALGDGAPVVGALHAALLDDSRFKLDGVLAGLMEAGAIVGWAEAPVGNRTGAPA
ncbi:MAG: DNA-binding domain-containing protein [Rhizomicrobium sp.]